MSQLFTGMLNLSKISKEKIVKNKAGESCIWVSIWLNDTPDTYGNTISIQMQQSKEEIGQPKVYLGNAKPKEAKQPEPPQSNKAPWEE